MIGIYKIENIKNGKVYIGSSKDINKRWQQHINGLRRNNHHSSRLQEAWNKSSENNFKFEVVEECNISELLEREDYYIKQFDSFINGYNMTESVFKFWKTYKKYKKEITQEKYLIEYAELKEFAETMDINIFFDIAPSKVKRVRMLLEYYMNNCNWEYFTVDIESYRPKVTLRILYNNQTIEFLMTKGGKILKESNYIPGILSQLNDMNPNISLYKENVNE